MSNYGIEYNHGIREGKTQAMEWMLKLVARWRSFEDDEDCQEAADQLEEHISQFANT